MVNIGIKDTSLFADIEKGKIYAYLYKGRLCIGEAIKNLNERSGCEYVMKNVYTGKIEYPYTMNIIEPNSEYKEIKAKIEYEDARY